ncbi:MAG: UDP-glucose/GDP-mannose dehydrogenase family protein [Candidatus Cloacimonetes bacterium]|nr:UDP-glucose/GDP-mannose dehydrogenase family protein [Candidatus Cloacimonadota bacterium]MBS3766847.1 UDP-glucose/GDP-mannose dehydrogenase family protein [Candidatus Cloacimonadota bacterium]
MEVAIIGTGYVGLVSGTCIADMGHNVTCVDNNKDKIGMLNQGKMPIYERGLKEIVETNVEGGRLYFTTDIEQAVEKAKVVFIAVGTPPDEDGAADLQYVLAVAQEIGKYLNGYKVIVDKSTVPIGTADKVKATIQDKLDERSVNYEFDVISNPEFLREGVAIQDFLKPDRVIIGSESEKAKGIMKELYRSFTLQKDRVMFMDIRSAEMTKYAANAILATKISFMNEIARLCEKVDADVEDVRVGIGSDTRIGYKFLYPGVGYGGSCFPKDVKALIRIARENDTSSQILEAVEDVNEKQKGILVDKVVDHFGEDLTGKIFAVWGLSFKPMTDDMREAPSRVIIKQLIAKGARIQTYDPQAMKEARRIFGDNKNIIYTSDQYSALNNADALLLVTEWHQFRNPNFDRIKKLLKQNIIFDGRNQYKPRRTRENGFTYYCIGR